MTKKNHCDWDETVDDQFQYNLVIDYWMELNDYQDICRALNTPKIKFWEGIKSINNQFLKKGLLKCSLLNPYDLR